MNCSMPGFPVLRCLLEFAQTHVHWVGDGIQPSHPLMPPCPHAFNLSSIRVFSNELALCIRWQSIGPSASVLPMNIQDRFPLGWTDLTSMLSKALSRVCSNLCPLSQWYHPTISSSVTPFSSCPQCFAASGSFPMRYLFASGGASASVLPMNIQGWFP